MREKIILLGGGGHCKSVIDVIEQENCFEIAGIIDKKELLGSEVLGYRVIGCDEDLQTLRDEYSYAVVTVGHISSNALRIKLFSLAKTLDFTLPTIISPLAHVSKHAIVKEGSVVMHHALINANAKIGVNCIINSKALIEHDAIIENNVHISTNATINGGVVVKEHSFVGSGVVTKEYTELQGFIKAGSLVK
jgi:sugar O-acyltransferase (sialic acid O-acetyltransferase NeuD family)